MFRARDGDNKIEDVHTTKIVENCSQENAELIWSLSESVSLAAKSLLMDSFLVN